MKTQLECIPCIVNSYLRLVETGVIPENRKDKLLRKVLLFLSETDYAQSPPVLGRELHQMIREDLKDPDPYLRIKETYNRMMLDLYPSFKQRVERSEDPFDTAMRLAIAGNVIDFGAKYQFDVMETINQALLKRLAIDDSQMLRRDLARAQTLLYIGDNCGEVVLDKLFLESIQIPKKYFVVRQGPIINDITTDDAKMTGIDQVAHLITTGDVSPGAVWEKSSEEFRNLFNLADVVISKGQGNLEGLLHVEHDSLYFLLITKCDLIAETIGVDKGAYVVKRNTAMNDSSYV